MRNKFIGAMIALLTGSALSVATPSEAPAASARPTFGVNFHGMWSSYTNAERLAVLDQLAAARVEWVRIDMGWSSFETKCQGCYEKWYLDRANFVVDAARARGMQVLVMLHRTPAWANGGQAVNVPPSNPADFGPFARWVAGQFKGRVAAWQIWNEPNHPSFWTGTASEYTSLLKVAYPEIKAADAAATVVIGGPVCNNDPWLAQVYAAGAKGSFDVMATQPYQVPSDLEPEIPDTTGKDYCLISHVPAVLNLMQRYGDGSKEIWFTEFGWSSHENTGLESKYRRGVTLEQQADYLVRTLQFVGANYPYVKNVFWYEERNNDSSSTDLTKKVHLDNFGLLYRDLTPKPAYEAVKSFLTSPPPAAPTEEPSPRSSPRPKKKKS